MLLHTVVILLKEFINPTHVFPAMPDFKIVIFAILHRHLIDIRENKKRLDFIIISSPSPDYLFLCFGVAMKNIGLEM